MIMGAKQFGASVARVEDPLLLTGRARFVDDIKLPGLLHACFVRSPHPHARIGAIDTAAAQAMPGVHAVLTADDMPGRLACDPIPTPVPHSAASRTCSMKIPTRGLNTRFFRVKIATGYP